MAKLSTGNAGQQRPVKRRTPFERSKAGGWRTVRKVITDPASLWGAVICLGAFVAITTITTWSRERVLIQPDQVMSATRIARVDFRIPDEDSTQIKRDEARKAAPQVYELNDLYLDRFSGQLNGLPKAVAGKSTIAEISAELQEEFRLTDAALASLQQYAVDGATTQQWLDMVGFLVDDVLPKNPLLTSEEYQNHWAAREYSPTLKRIVIKRDGRQDDLSGDAIELIRDPSGELDRKVERLVQKAGFPPDVSPFIAAKVLSDLKPTLIYDAETTSRLAEQAASRVPMQFSQHHEGDNLYKRGDKLTAGQYERVLAEHDAYYSSATDWRIWAPRIGAAGLIGLAMFLLAVFIARFQPRIARNPLRVLAICVTMTGMLLIAAVVAPKFYYLAAVAPVLFVTVVLLVAYDQKLAGLATLAQSAFVTLALGAGIGWMILLLCGCGATIAQLRELRNRNSLIRAAIVTAAVFGGGAILLGLYEMPSSLTAMQQILQGALWTVAGSFGVGFVVMGILPTIERLFGITTGMTLAELRDPKQTLLRQLQQKAPGTYNHSLQVANIAEAAAEAIGADGLLVYVGALYHDVGKMNKPEYFIENQIDGYNKHEKLSPAMSLLVIVGHVKDGIELAREYNLPRSIIHFIESHHGTTLVEYFYHAARTQAEARDNESVDEVRFRYPGPKPQTREAAILMLSDAVESATRAMKEPNPARIESLVRELSHKRMLDGQFDQCDLTFRQLTQIEDAIISRVCAIHHGRIMYPTAGRTAEPRREVGMPLAERNEAAKSA